MTVYERLRQLKSGQTAFVDYDDTLWVDGKPNKMLIESLIQAQNRGVSIHLWTHANFYETIIRVENMRKYGLRFDFVHCGIEKADLIIDNLAVTP